MAPCRRHWSQPWIVILCATLVFTVSGGVCAAKPASNPLRIAYLSLSGHIREAPSNFAIMFAAPPQTTLNRFIEHLKQAEDDRSIAAVLLAIDRPIIQWAQVDELRAALGRVFTGRQAVENGLANRIGGLHDAIEATAVDVGADDFEVRFLPKPKTFANLIRDSLSPETKIQALRKMVGADIIYGDENALAKAYQLISLLHEEQVLMFMPYSIVIRP